MPLQNQIYIEDDNGVSDREGVVVGKWKNAPQRFIKEYTDNGFCKIIFGGGDMDTSELNDFIGCRGQIDRIGNTINNQSLGVIPQTDNTLFVRYRVGGGEDTNIGPNSVNNLGTISTILNGADANINRIIRNSISVNNPIPALGGKEQPSVE